MSAEHPILSPSEIAKIAAIAALMQSPADGEALAAARALVQRLDKHSLRISEVIAVGLSPTRHEEPTELNHAATAERCLQYAELFNDFELKFLTSIRGFRRISEKQNTLLQEFAQRVAS
jgi:hypothetical protein